MSLIGKEAPKFKARAWYRNHFRELTLDDFNGKYLILFFYPLDFGFVCPTDILAFNSMATKFEMEGKCLLLGCSVDSELAHMEYCKKPRKEGGLGELDIPLISDIHRKIARDYGCFCEAKGHAHRATYIIDELGFIRYFSIGDFEVGRKPEEYFRLVKALQYVDAHDGEVCPANW